jgi:hypothetical protein
MRRRLILAVVMAMATAAAITEAKGGPPEGLPPNHQTHPRSWLCAYLSWVPFC